jgi:hypothetical protein
MSTIAVNSNANIVVETAAASAAATVAETASAVPSSANTAPAAADADPAAAAPSAAVNTPAAVYSAPATVEAAHTDNEQIIVRSRNDFVSLYRACEAKTALATLDMCRAAYEAFKILNEAEFEAFCKEIGYKDASSTIRKFLAIGKVAPRLVAYADRLPASWTSIYMLTQIPASVFERMVENKRIFKTLKSSDVAELVKETRVITSITAHLPVDKELRSIKFASVSFTKMPVDDVDWRAMRKAFAEIEGRLPIRFDIDKRAEEAWLKRKDTMYEQSKSNLTLDHFKPERWDFGREANAVAHKRLPVVDDKSATAATEAPETSSKPAAA